MSWLHKALQRAMETKNNNDDEIDILSDKDGGSVLSEKRPLETGGCGEALPEAPSGIRIFYTQTSRRQIDENLVKKNRILLPDEKDSQLIEQYKILRAQIFKRAEEKKWRTLMITSLGKGEGKTLTAINLSILIAQELHQTALLVDADLKKESILSLFGIDESKGLSDYLLQGTPLPELLINPGIDGFTILPSGKPMQKTAEILRSSRMASLVKELKDRYEDRYIIFDVPPLLFSTDALALSKYIDAVILVIEAGKTTKVDMKKGGESLQWMNILGVVLNKCILNKKSYV